MPFADRLSGASLSLPRRFPGFNSPQTRRPPKTPPRVAARAGSRGSQAGGAYPFQGPGVHQDNPLDVPVVPDAERKAPRERGQGFQKGLGSHAKRPTSPNPGLTMGSGGHKRPSPSVSDRCRDKDPIKARMMVCRALALAHRTAARGAPCDLEKIYFAPPFRHGMGIAQTKSGLSL